MRDVIEFVLGNFTLTFFVGGLIASAVALWHAHRPRSPAVIVEALFSYFLLFSIAIANFYNFVLHVFFGKMTAAFIGGRFWEHRTSTGSDLAANVQPQQRVVVVVLTDHLDRTERLLVQLNHADSGDKVENAQLQTEARELLASNRLYRVSANKEGDPALAGALDRLERVLAEVANDPHLTAADLERVRKDMNTSGILFEVRVLLARKPNQESGPMSAKGVSI